MIKNKFSCKREELTINGLVYRAEGDKLPTIILSHGFMANYKTTEAYAKRFAKMGYAAFIYDFNGGGMFSKSEGKTTDMSVLTEKKDLRAVIDAVCELSYVDEDNLTLLGCSQGGLVSAMVANDIPDKVKRLILFYPALCVPDDARTGQMMFAKFDPQNVPQIVKCGPMKLGRQYVTDVLEMNPFEQIRNYSGPVLIIHGTADDVVAMRYVEQAYDTYLEGHGGKPSAECQLVTIEGANHGFRGMKARLWNDYAFFAIEKFIEGKTIGEKTCKTS